MWRQPPFDFAQGRLSAVPRSGEASGAGILRVIPYLSANSPLNCWMIP